jgi:GntR family transcriptional regulator
MTVTRGPVPLYFRIESALRERIRSGHYAPMSSFPTEEMLREEFGVSRGTVRLALDALRREGLIVSYAGRGTLVTGHVTRARTLRFAGSIEELIAHGSETEFRVIESGLAEATAIEAAELKVPEGRPVFRITGLRARGGHRLAAVVVTVPETLGVLMHLPKDAPSPPVARLIIEQLGQTIREARQIIAVAVAEQRVASLLGVPVGSPLLEIRRTFYAADATPVEFARSLYPGDKYQYETTIST